MTYRSGHVMDGCRDIYCEWSKEDQETLYSGGGDTIDLYI